MTGTERDAIQELRSEWIAFRDETVAFRDETRENAQALATELREYRDSLAPAVNLAANLDTAGRALAASGTFVKWGAGIGASAVTIIGGLKLMGVIG